jgi:hypothetical protein
MTTVAEIASAEQTIASAEQTIASRLKAAVSKYGHERLELEFRLGHLSGTPAGPRFSAGVSADSWARIKAGLDASGMPSTETRTTERVFAGHKHVTDDATGVVTGVHKKRLFDLDIQPPSEGVPWTTRASLSLETHEPPTLEVPQTSIERRKHRHSYAYKCWSFDITRVTGNGRDLDNDEPTYEVEVELADVTELFVRPMFEIARWGTQLAADMVKLGLK